MCTVQECGPCEHCVALYYKRPGEPLTGEWDFTSHCISLETHRESPNCEANGLLYPDRCVGTHQVYRFGREEVLSGRTPLSGVTCGCYETNCTAGMAEIKFDFVRFPVVPTDACKYRVQTSFVIMLTMVSSNFAEHGGRFYSSYV